MWRGGDRGGRRYQPFRFASRKCQNYRTSWVGRCLKYNSFVFLLVFGITLKESNNISVQFAISELLLHYLKPKCGEMFFCEVKGKWILSFRMHVGCQRKDYCFSCTSLYDWLESCTDWCFLNVLGILVEMTILTQCPCISKVPLPW